MKRTITVLGLLFAAVLLPVRAAVAEPLPTSLTLVAPEKVRVGVPVPLAGTLTGVPVGTPVTITGPEGFSDQVAVDEDGQFRVYATANSVPRRATYVASFTGDDTYAPSSDTAVAVAKWRTTLTTVATGPRTVIGRISYYRSSTNASFSTSQFPRQPNMCHTYLVQRIVDGRWKKVTSSPCRPFSVNYGKSTWAWTGRHLDRVTYRVFAQLAENQRVYASTAQPAYVRFR